MELYGYEIRDISKDGITFERGGHQVRITFDDCIKNFSDEFGCESKTCIAVRDVQSLSFTFFTAPKTTICCRKSKRRGILSDYFAARRFHSLQNELTALGFTTYDAS